MAPVHARLTAVLERRFQRTLTALKTSLPLMLDTLQETEDPRALAAAALEAIATALNTSRAALIMEGTLVAAHGVEEAGVRAWRDRVAAGGPAKLIDCADALFPLRFPLADEPSQQGWILLGPRPDGSGHGSEEREALAALAPFITRALFVATARAERTAGDQLRFDRLNGALAALRDRICALERPRPDATGLTKHPAAYPKITRAGSADQG